MWEVLRRNPLTLGIAILMHLAIVALMVWGLDWLQPAKPKPSKVQVVQARVVDAQKLQTEMDKVKSAEAKKQADAAAKRKKEEQRLAEIKRKREAEKKKLAELENKRKAKEAEEAKRKKEARKKAEQEKKRQADLKKKEAEKKKQAELERKRKAEEKKRKEAKALAEKKKKEEAARKKAEAERKRKEAEAKRLRAEQQARERELAAQMAAEQDAAETSQVVAAIQSKIQRNWLRPPGTAEQGLRCTVRVRLGNTGSVLLVQIVKSSGNGAFDRSVEAAVRKADPLPMPSSPRLQATFRDINFEFDPSR